MRYESNKLIEILVAARIHKLQKKKKELTALSLIFHNEIFKLTNKALKLNI